MIFQLNLKESPSEMAKANPIQNHMLLHQKYFKNTKFFAANKKVFQLLNRIKIRKENETNASIV